MDFYATKLLVYAENSMQILSARSMIYTMLWYQKLMRDEGQTNLWIKEIIKEIKLKKKIRFFMDYSQN